MDPEDREKVQWYAEEYRMAEGSIYTLIAGGADAVAGAMAHINASMRPYVGNVRAIHHGPFGSMAAAWSVIPSNCQAVGGP